MVLKECAKKFCLREKEIEDEAVAAYRKQLQNKQADVEAEIVGVSEDVAHVAAARQT